MENPGIFLMVFMKLCRNGWHDFCPPVFFAFFWTAFLSFLSSAQFWSGVEGASTGDLLDAFNFLDLSFMLVLHANLLAWALLSWLISKWNDDLCKQSKFHNIDQLTTFKLFLWSNFMAAKLVESTHWQAKTSPRLWKHLGSCFLLFLHTSEVQFQLFCFQWDSCFGP